MEKKFDIVSNMKPKGDQPQAIESLSKGFFSQEVTNQKNIAIKQAEEMGY